MVRIAAGMLLLAGVYTAAHIRLLAQRGSIEAGREAYAIFGDPRRTEMRRGEVRGWMLDCTASDENAFAMYQERGGLIERVYPIGEAGANFIGGGKGAEERDYTIETLFTPELRRPANFLELGEIHPGGRDLDLTLCREATRVAWERLRQAGRPGAVIVQDVRSGAVLAYAATGGPETPPVGIKQYSPPGSVFKLALSAVWWENGLPDDLPIPCPSSIRVNPRASISNAGGVDRGEVIGPEGMLVPSCNTAAVEMAWEARRRIGSEPFIEAYRRFGFLPYEKTPPTDSIGEFWRSSSAAWSQRMTPSPSRIRISAATDSSEWAQMAIGQGPVDVTVAGVSRFIQAIGNGGVMLPPTIEARFAARPPRGERVMREETAAKLRKAMLAVVDFGTGTAARGQMGATRWKIGGKTGTAQVAGAADNGWFAGLVFDPEGNARFSIVAFLEGGGPGGGQPAVIAGSVARVLASEPTGPEGD
jgi:cell division protein FtsI/penicillin-binding protein 2